MGELDKQIVAELKGRLPATLLRHLREMILYGSRARGDAAEDADLDLVALVDEKTPEIERALEDIAYDVMWEHDFQPIISLKVLSEDKFRDSLDKGLSFYRNVKREGIVL